MYRIESKPLEPKPLEPKPPGSEETAGVSSANKSETNKAPTGSQPSGTQAAVNNGIRTADVSTILKPSFGSTSASQANSVGESSFTPSQHGIQDMLLPGYWAKQYQDKAGTKASANLMTNKKFWTTYSGGTKGPKAGEARRPEDVNKMINDKDSDLNKQLDALGARENQPSLDVYKSISNDQKNPDGTWKLTGHVGDHDQAAKYLKSNDDQTFLKMTLKPGAHKLLFSPEHMAMDQNGTQGRPIAALSEMEKRGKYRLTPKNGEGTLPGYIGLKPEEGGTKFSLGIGKSKASEALFKHFVATWEEGRKGADGKWEPKG